MSLNRHMVAASGGRVGMVIPPAPGSTMTPADAVELAAWLVVMAEVVDPSVDFAAALAEVRSS